MISGQGRRKGRSPASLYNDTSGMALIYVTLALPVIIGMALLAVDFSRLANLHSSLQHGADALALAGAAELDQRPDAIVRSDRALENLINQNKSAFGTSVVDINWRPDNSGSVNRCY